MCVLTQFTNYECSRGPSWFPTIKLTRFLSQCNSRLTIILSNQLKPLPIIVYMLSDRWFLETTVAKSFASRSICIERGITRMCKKPREILFFYFSGLRFFNGSENLRIKWILIFISWKIHKSWSDLNPWDWVSRRLYIMSPQSGTHCHPVVKEIRTRKERRWIVQWLIWLHIELGIWFQFLY